MGAGIGEVRWQRSGDRVAASIGLLRLQDPGCTGAEEDADACHAVAGLGSLDRRFEAVLGEGKGCQAVVAAVELAERRVEVDRFEPGHLADVCRQVHGFETTWQQTAGTLLQRRQSCGTARAEAAGNAVCGHRKRLHGADFSFGGERNDLRWRGW